MGAKTCKCNVGEDEEAQLKLSREAEGNGKYDFPSQDLGVSALAGSSQSSSYVPPLPPGVNGESGHYADMGDMHAMSSITTGKLPSVVEETGEELESLSRHDSETAGRAARREDLSELKEALLECADEKGHLVTLPGEEVEERMYRKLSERNRFGTAGEDDDGRRAASLVNGDGQTIDMTLPAATGLALRGEAMLDNRGLQHDRKADGLTYSSDQPEHAQFTCWQMAENTGSCVCPFGSSSLELRRDGRSPGEHYDLHGTTGLPAPEHVSALAIPPAHDQGELHLSHPDSRSDGQLHPETRSPGEDLQDFTRGNSTPPGDLRATAQESGDPALNGTLYGVEPSQSDRSGRMQELALQEEDGLDGDWVNEGQTNTLKGSSITFASGETCAVEPTSKTTLHMVLEGTVYYGRLSPDRKKLLWSDGDVWTRKAVRKPTLGAPESPEPLHNDVSAGGDDARSDTKDSSGAEADRRQATNASKQSGRNRDKEKKPEDIAKDGEKRSRWHAGKSCCTIA